MKTLDRNRIDGIVRELETEAYRLALALMSEPASADRILLDAFSGLAPSLARATGIVELRQKLHARIRQGATRHRLRSVADERSDQEVAISESLHRRIVDLLEEEQAVEPVGRRKVVLGGVIGLLLVGALVALFPIYSDTLAAAQPTIAGLYPAAGAKDVPVVGEFRVTFGRRPAGTPTMRLNPATGKLESAHWEGSTLVAGYSGLQEATRYEIVLAADYRSSLIDLGHYVKRWTLTTERYAVLAAVTPTEGQLQAPRVGQISVEFNHRPSVEPRISLMPADGTIQAGHWSVTTWTASYTGLRALTRYQATLTIDYGVAAANIRRQWAFSTEPGAPPPGVPVIWYGTRNPREAQSDPQRLLAIDWHGNLAGTMYLRSGVVQQAPDGSALITQDGGYVNRTGVPRAFADPNLSMVTDDSRSVCTLAYPGGAVGVGQPWLLTGPIGGPMRRVAQVGWVGAPAALGIFACSVATDRAVVGDAGDRDVTTGIRVIALSTGQVLYQGTYAGLGARIISSHDGRYLAEQMPPNAVQGQPLAVVTMIRRTVDGRVVARIDNQRVVQFSWDGMRVVTAPFFEGPGPYDAQLIEWRTGKILWRQAGYWPFYAMAQPNGPNMAVAIGSHSAGDADQLWLVAADGHATQVLNVAFYSAFGGRF